MTTSLQPIHLLWLGSVSYWSEDKQRTFPRFLYNTGLLWVHIHKRQRLPQNLCCCIYCTDSALLSTNVGFLYCHQLCVALNTVTVSLWFHWKDFPPSFSLCGLVSGNGWGCGVRVRGAACIALHVASCCVSGNDLLAVKWTAVPYTMIVVLFFLSLCFLSSLFMLVRGKSWTKAAVWDMMSLRTSGEVAGPRVDIRYLKGSWMLETNTGK